MFRVADEFRYPAQRTLLLASLPDRELAGLAPLLVRTQVAHGTRLDAAAETRGMVLFPETAIVCACADGPTGKPFGLGMIGREGVLGWHGLAGGAAPEPQCAVTLAAGSALAIETSALDALCTAEPRLLRTFLSFAYLFSLQLAATLRSNIVDPVDARLARWLLLFHDRVGDDEMTVTHDLLAELLAVRRATVTDALHVLEGERLVICTRGRIVVRSRAGLEARAGAAYGGAERAYSALVAPFGK